MNKTEPAGKGKVLVLLITIALLLVFYGRMVWSPGAYFLSSEGDGIKNYYTYSWHVAYDSSYTHFGGMNYPYGEHVVFTDNQPLLSNTCLWLKNIFPGITDHLIGIHNSVLFLGLLFAIFFLYKLFFALTKNWSYALLASLCIGFLSPQIARFHGHFALAYCFVVPLSIWWLYLFFRKPGWYLSAALGTLLFLLLFIHVYYLIILGGLIIALWLVYLIRKQCKLSFPKILLHISLQVVLPFLLYFVWLRITDVVQDRPSQPYGIVEYAANWEGLLLPLDYAYFQPFKSILGVRKVSLESIAYAGFPILVFVASGLIILLLRLFRKRQTASTEKAADPFVHNLLIAVTIIFCYAAFVPYLFDIPSVSKYLGLLKQFRSLGRLLWAVFYGLNIYFFVLLFKLGEKRKFYKIAAYLSFLVMAIEGIGLNNRIAEAIKNPGPSAITLPEGVNRQHYSAILSIPFFHEGSENIGATPANDEIIKNSFRISLQTGIPLYAVKMSRTSLQQTLKQLELAFDITSLPGPLHEERGAFLILKQRSATSTIEGLSDLKKIYSDKEIELYAVRKEELQQLLKRNAGVKSTQLNGTSEALAHYDFEAQKTEKCFMGKGALYGKTSDALHLLDREMGEDSIEISFWLYAGMEGLPQLKLLVGEGKDAERVQVTQHIDAMRNEWMRVTYRYEGKGKRLMLRLVKENAAKGQEFFLDELLVRSLRKDYLEEKDGILMINNRPYPLP